MPENVITEIAKPQNVCFTIVCKYSDSLSKQLFKNIHIMWLTFNLQQTFQPYFH